MPFNAKYRGVCSVCGLGFAVGQAITGKMRNYSHAVCPKVLTVTCLLCTKMAVEQTFPFGDDETEFMEAYDRGCGAKCNCDGKFYHINDFCSVSCVADATQMYEDEKVG
jgi:hypothetical protein